MFKSQRISLLQSQHVDDIPEKTEKGNRIEVWTEIQRVFMTDSGTCYIMCQTRNKK